MRRVYYNKLVRDNIKDIIESHGSSCEVRVIDDSSEFEQELLKKVAEEGLAVSHAKDRETFLKEYADLMIVLDALTLQLELSEADVETAIKENLLKKGGFEKRHYLHWSEDDSYQSNESISGVTK